MNKQKSNYDQLGLLALTLSVCGITDETTGKIYFPSSEESFNILRGATSIKQYCQAKSRAL